MLKKTKMKTLSMLMVFTLFLQLFSGVVLPATGSAEAVSPVINGDGSVSFNYASQGEKALFLIGNFTNNWNLNDAIEMNEKDGIFSVTVYDLQPGEYQYKFVKNNRTWDESTTDPANPNQKDGNSVFSITMLESPIINEDGSVTFNYKKTDETAAYVIGGYNDWNLETAVEMTLNGDIFSATLSDLKPGTYEYKFVLNKRSWDQSTTDPLNKESANGNSVFTIESSEPTKVKSALMDSTTEMVVTTNKAYGDQQFTVIDQEANEKIPTTKQVIDDNKVILKVAVDEEIDVRKQYVVSVGETEGIPLIMRNILNDERFYYEGDDLGYTYTSNKTNFNIWAPTATKVSLAIYENAGTYDGAFVTDHTDGKETKMNREDNGVWSVEIPQDLKNKYYMYKLEFSDGTVNYAVDPYARATSANGQRGAIVDLRSTDPTGFDPNDKPAVVSPNDAIVYELHVRDFSIDEQSGMENKGKYLAFTEKETKGPNGVKTGVDSLKELGVNYVHLLPTYDFGSVNELTVDDPTSTEAKFNWGYDPVHFNVPEGSYSTNPQDPTNRIKEYKQMVQALHEQGIRVVMDVVYNHTYMNESTQLDGNSPFDLIIPGYYYRTDDTGKITNGSGTGNEVASERPMVRKYIKDSVHYWATEYGIDGFRFDLMGLIDKQTMQEITKELTTKVDPNILLYGEPWTGGSTSLPAALQHVKGTQKDQGYAVFNDHIRGAIKGDSDGAGTGFATGATGKEADTIKGVQGAIYDFTNRSSESINYVTAHDNLNLWDKLMRVAGTDSDHTNSNYDPHAVITEENSLDNEWVKRSLLANGIVLTSQGIPFLHAGEEMLRSKYGVHNSYKSPDSINKIRWELKAEYESVYNYYKGLIDLRKSHSAFKMNEKADIENHLEVLKQEDNVVAYQLKDYANNDTWKNIIVIYNANKTAKEVTLPSTTEWKIVVDHTTAGTETIRTIHSNKISVEGLSMMVLYDNAEEAYTPVPTSIEVNPTFVAMNPSDSKMITAYVKDQKGRIMLGEEIEWSSSNDDIATVGNGKIVGIAKGEVTITAKAGGSIAEIQVTVDNLVPNTIQISGYESVFETYSTQLTSLVKDQYGQDMLGVKVAWSSSDESIAKVDSAGKVTGVKPGFVTITAKSGGAVGKHDMEIKKNVKRYVRIKYVRPEGDFKTEHGDWNLWVWNTGVKNDQIDFESIEGDTAIANVEIAPETESIGFLVRRGTDWNTAKISPDSDDHTIKIDRQTNLTKVTVVTGVQGQTIVPNVNGPVLENGDVTFYYRDEELFATDEMHKIDAVSVKITNKEYPMEYSEQNEYFTYKLENIPEGTHEYSLLVTRDGETVEVTDPKNTKNGKSTITYNRPSVTVEASVSPNEITYDESTVLTANASSEEDVTIRELSVNLSPLGGKEKVMIDPSVGAVSFSVDESVTAGAKEIVVTAIDEYGNTHTKTVKLIVKPEQIVGDKLDFDWDEARIYFLLTDRFKDGDPSNNGGEEYDPDHAEAYHGGDFQGIIDKLEYIEDLGINTIWITPIVDNINFNKGLDFTTADGLQAKQYGYHGYWAKDFTQLDEHLGDIKTFQKLIEKAHDRGIKIMLDVVVNHAGYGMNGEFNETWKADSSNLPTEEEIEKFDGMFRTVDEDPTVRGELDHLPDFKTEDPEVRKQIIEWQTAWLERARTDRGDTIDFFRIDTVKHVEQGTWQALKNEITKIDPNFKMIGELWGASIIDDGDYLGTGQMDSLLDFDFKEKAKSFVDGNIDSVEDYLQNRNNQLSSTATLGQFLSSHDQNGFLSEYVDGDVGKLKVASALQITSKGQPVIYYGEELGKSGKSDWEKDGETVVAFGQNRGDMPWELLDNNDPTATALHKHYSTLLNIRKDYSLVFSKGTRKKIAGGDADQYLVFAREYQDQQLVVGLNTTSKIKQATFTVDFEPNSVLTDLYNNKEIIVDENKQVQVDIPSKDDGGTVILALVHDDPGENPGEDPGEDPDKTPGGNNGKDPGKDTGKDSSQGPGKNPSQNPGDNQGNSDVASPNTGKNGEKLPSTATDFYNWLAVGAALILFGAVFIVLQKRRQGIRK